jgi:hypothetical protein
MRRIKEIREIKDTEEVKEIKGILESRDAARPACRRDDACSSIPSRDTCM